jgi:hypothetical protein
MQRHSGHRSVLANALVFGALAILVLGCADSVQAQEHLITPLGRAAVGSTLSEVQLYSRSKNCLIEGDNADCTFTDGNGVAYVVLKNSVTTVMVSEETAGPNVQLPFRLAFGDGLDAAAAKLVSGGNLWTLGKDPDRQNGIVLVSSRSYPGKNGWEFGVEIRFDKNRLISVSYVSGTM